MNSFNSPEAGCALAFVIVLRQILKCEVKLAMAVPLYIQTVQFANSLTTRWGIPAWSSGPAGFFDSQQIPDQNWSPCTRSPNSNRSLFPPRPWGRGVRSTIPFIILQGMIHLHPKDIFFFFTFSVMNKIQTALTAIIMKIISFTEKTENMFIQLLFIFLFAVAFKPSVSYPNSSITLALRLKQHQHLLRRPVTVRRRVS